MKKIINFNDNWVFEMPGVPSVSVDLPHTWNGVDGQDGGDDYKRLACTYSKTFVKPDLSEGDACLLVFNGVNSQAEVILNEKSLCKHDGGYSKFVVDITAYVKDENSLVVIVDNSANDRVYPQKADFTFYGGIYRDVIMEIQPKNRFAYRNYAAPPLRVTPSVENGTGYITVDANTVGKGDVVITVSDMQGKTVAAGTPDEKISVSDVHLWQGIKDPYLYTVKAELFIDGNVIDTIECKTAFRTFVVDPKRGFILNGEEYPLRGVCRHQDRPIIGNAVNKNHHEEDIRLIKEIGANTVRLAHYQHDDYFYDLCDKEGFVVWAEIPYISKHLANGNENAELQMTELISQLYNHPSIFVWGISNEITMFHVHKKDMLETHKRLNELCHKLDSTRYTTLACYAVCGYFNKTAHITDLVSWNLYLGWYTPFLWLNKVWFALFRMFYPKRPIGMSEYGAEAMTNLHSKRPKRGDNSEEYQLIYHEYMLNFFKKRKYLWATHVWNMFDFAADARNQGGEPGMNHKGLVTFDRKTKKDSFYLYKAYWSKEPFVHACGSRFAMRTGKKIQLKVYSNQSEIAVYNNGKLVGKKKGNKIFKFTFDMNSVNEIKVVSGILSDKITIKKVDNPYEEYSLKKKKTSSGTVSWQK